MQSIFVESNHPAMMIRILGLGKMQRNQNANIYNPLLFHLNWAEMIWSGNI